MPVIRTQEEIIARYHERVAHDFLGFETNEYLGALTYENARPYLLPKTTAEEWAADTAPFKGEALDEYAKSYLTFAIDKATGHRSMSAARSIGHYMGWMWLLGRAEEINWDNYPMYGVPILSQIAEVMGWGDKWAELTTDAVESMALGQPCRPDCDEC